LIKSIKIVEFIGIAFDCD